MSDGIDSDGNPRFTLDDAPTMPEGFDFFSGGGRTRLDDEIIDGEIVDEQAEAVRSRIKSDGTERGLERAAKAGIPNIDEWQDFFSRVLVRLATDWYIDIAFRGIDDDLLSQREIDKIHLSKTERDRISRPFAEFSLKSKFMRKHGRSIIAAGDSVESVVQLGMWFSRVNRIAAKYRRMLERTGPVPMQQRPPQSASMFASQYSPPASSPEPAEETSDVSSDTSASNGRKRVRPDILGTVIYGPDSGTS